MDLLLDPGKIHESWEPFATSEYKFLCLAQKEIVPGEICPEVKFVLRFLQTDLNNAKIVILGQDPYPQPGAATGRAFEVGGLESFLGTFRQASLKNILRLIYKAYTGKEVTWRGLQRKMETGEFRVLPPDKLFASWEEQGVLLLNSSLTCHVMEPMSHAAFWEPFTKDLLLYISEKRPNLIWFLWGKNAVKTAERVAGKKYISRHPMLCGSSAGDDFLKNACFDETKDTVYWTGIR